MIIAIDGPAGAGKSTVAKILAKRLGFLYVDTGSMYRAITLKALEKNININDKKALVALAKNSQIELKNTPAGKLKVYLDGKDVTSSIRVSLITKFVSEVARLKEIRKIMVRLQRNLAKDKDAVLEGRDIGTVVFPKADFKFYLDASFKERVRRRFKELKCMGQKITLKEIEKDIRRRDYIDSNRSYAPLKKAKDAFYLDTTKLSIEEVVEELLKKISSRYGKRTYP
ncbi:MAG: (d)CMP kinase [Candidatus Omnitrophica bacterium]|nr:(d)CMP kinase [Candidatus Omnitrophota bacterium]MCM8800247.1 (d)CMP kinase [Candidatus Omnitrophota bacterium]